MVWRGPLRALEPWVRRKPHVRWRGIGCPTSRSFYNVGYDGIH